MTLTSDRSTAPYLPGGSAPRPAGPRSFANALPHLVWHALPDGRFDYVGGDWCAFTGLSRAASFGNGWQRALHPDDLARWQASWDAANGAGLTYELEYRLRHADGGYCWFLAHTEAIRGERGEIAGWVGTATALDECAPPPAVRDVAAASIGERWQREQELLAAVRQQHLLVAIAAHDIKNQLTVMRGVAQLVERHVRSAAAPEPERILRGLGTIQGGTRKMQRLVEEFLDLSRVQSGEPVEFNRQPTDLVALARDCVQEYAQTSDRDLTLSTPAETLIGEWDAARLERVVANLLSNAIKYSASASAIRVTLTRDGNGAVLVVQDEGVGIPAADLPYIFEPFYRGSNVAQQTAGSGIGLFGARALVEQQGGTLRVESAVGRGTTFTVRLPLDPPPVPNLSELPETP